MTNWTEVNVYTGRPVDEDAPTNFAGAGSGVDMNPTGMKKKKKKLIDARSKSYKSHRAKLEASRVKREAKRTGVKEEVELDEMKKVEIKLNRGNVDKDIQKIVKHIGFVNKKRRPNQQIKITQNMSDDSVTLDGGNNVDIDREVADIRNFIGFKSAKVVESVERKNFSQKVKESATEFNVESLLAEDNVDVLKSIVKSKSMKPIKLRDGTMTIDMQTANMMLTVLDKVKPDNQRKLAKMMNGKKSEFMKVHGFVMKALGK